MWNLQDYRYAASAAEAVSLLRQGPGRGVYIAGGTDLFRFPPTDCDFVVDITGAGLGEIARTPAGDLFLGATATLQEIAASELIAGHAGGAVAAAALRCGNRPVRSVATVGGNIGNALPSADMAPVLLVLDAVAHIADLEGTEELPLKDLFTGPRGTVLGDRLLVGLSLPAATAGWAVRARKLTRSAEDISLVQVAVSLALDGSTVSEARVALGAVAPTPRRALAAEKELGRLDLRSAVSAERIAVAAAGAAAAAEPINDFRASAAYRRAMVEVLTRRLVGELAAQAGGESA